MITYIYNMFKRPMFRLFTLLCIFAIKRKVKKNVDDSLDYFHSSNNNELKIKVGKVGKKYKDFYKSSLKHTRYIIEGQKNGIFDISKMTCTRFYNHLKRQFLYRTTKYSKLFFENENPVSNSLENFKKSADLRSIGEKKLLSDEKSESFISKKNTLTYEELQQIVKDTKNDMIIDVKLLEKIFEQAICTFVDFENINFVETTKEVVIIGDTHGQCKDTIKMVEENLNNDCVIIFNGDFVDRGCQSVENIAYILGLKLVFPEKIFLNRGNHEFSGINSVYGSKKEFLNKYSSGENLYLLMCGALKLLPLATMVNEMAFVVHGGLPKKPVLIKEIMEIDRKTDKFSDETFLALMWADPVEKHEEKHRDSTSRPTFEEIHTKNFLDFNGLRVLIRSHEWFEGGYNESHNKKVITIFSAPDYMGYKSKAAYLVINPKFVKNGEMLHSIGDFKYKIVYVTSSLYPEKYSF